MLQCRYMGSFSGIVRQGKKRGSELGYPTINIDASAGLVAGVYVARVLLGDALFPAAAFADPARGILEAHILDASGDWYGKEASIELVEKIRETESFSDDESLRSAIAGDIAYVREYYKN